MPKKKLMNGPIIEVDPQIIRWQKKLKPKGFGLSNKARQKIKKARSENEAIVLLESIVKIRGF